MRPGNVLHVAQGEHAVSGDGDTMITTILGSCVAACLWDGVARIGGMNHILLPHTPESDLRGRTAGVNAMELLINGLIRAGAARDRLEGKLFGGARMIAGLSDVGERNARFAAEFLSREGIPCRSSSLGGTQGRRVQFWPTTGRARQLLMPGHEVPLEVAPSIAAASPVDDEIELF